ncbi:MAG TPA: hypothetical protein VIN39_01505 [Candidatus Dormibacteraeota bacterium]
MTTPPTIPAAPAPSAELPITGAVSAVAASPPTGSAAASPAGSAQALVLGSTPQPQPALTVPPETATDNPLLLIAIGIISLPMLFVMALVATVLTRR